MGNRLRGEVNNLNVNLNQIQQGKDMVEMKNQELMQANNKYQLIIQEKDSQLIESQQASMRLSQGFESEKEKQVVQIEQEYKLKIQGLQGKLSSAENERQNL